MSRGIKPYAMGPNEGLRLEGATWSVPFVIHVTVDTSASSFTVTSDCPRDLRVLDAWVICTAADALGTVNVENGTNPITDDMVCAVDAVVVHAGTIDDDYNDVAKGGTLQVTSGGTESGEVYILCEWRE